MKLYDIIVVSQEPFPYGRAASNRILSYTEPIAAQGKKVLLLTFSGPSYGNCVNKERFGIIKDVDFKWTGKTHYSKRPNFPIRVFLYFERKIVLYFLLLFKLRARTYIQVEVSSRLTLFVSIVSILKRARFIRDISETCDHDECKVRRKFRHFVCRFTNGIIAISPGIREYFNEITDDKRFFLLPALVDLGRFDVSKTEVEKPYFCYCSGGVLQRDGFLDSLKAFILFHQSHQNYTLRCAFPYNQNDAYHREVMNIIKANSDYIEYLGSLATCEIPKLLVNASALLVTPAVKYKTRGFPTKLGEYLASATPVICTSIEDLAGSIDDDCVLMASPGNVEEIAGMMRFVAENCELADKIGKKGRSFVERKYTIDPYLKPLIEFLFDESVGKSE